jgi:hypothetical protein
MGTSSRSNSSRSGVSRRTRRDLRAVLWGILTDTDFRLPGLPGYGYPLPSDLTPPELGARRLLIADGSPISQVEPKGTDATDYH